jgi:D-threo-aldose 1-dehydrogenase
MDPFKLRKLGTSDVMLPQMGFGGAPLGELVVKVPEAQATATLQAAWDAGIRYYDTAPWYGRGQSEHRVGRFLYQQPREEVLVSTKVGRVLRAPIGGKLDASGVGWIGGLGFDIRWDYTYDGIMRSYEDSLQRLGMTKVDVLVIHDLDFWHHRTEPLVNAYLAQLATSGYRALRDLKAAGLIGAIGAGINENGMIPRFLDLVDLDFFVLALRYTLGEHDTVDTEMVELQKRGIGIILAGVFSSGIYATGPVPGARYNYREATPAELERARRIEAVCKRHNVPLASVALQFPLHHPIVASVIPGAFAPEHVTANVATMRVEVPDALWHELKAEKLIAESAPTP